MPSRRRRIFLFLFLAAVLSPPSFASFCEPHFALLNFPERDRAAVQALLDKGDWQEAAWKALERNDRAGYERLESIIQSVLTSAEPAAPMELVKSGSSEVYRVAFGEGNSRIEAIFKPSPKFWQHKRIRPFHDDRAPDKEAAAYAFDRAVGGHIVPVTVKRTLNGMQGSLQVFVHLDSAATELKAAVPGQIRDLKRLRVLDYMMGTHDRTPMNSPPKNGAPVAIDNAMTFLTKPPHYSFGIQNPPRAEEIQNLAEYGEAIASFRGMDLEKARRALFDNLNEAEATAAFQRVKEIRALSEKIIPAQGE